MSPRAALVAILPATTPTTLAALSLAVVLAAAALAAAGCGSPASNCGRYDLDGWEAPEGCVCRGPEGESTYVDPLGKEVAIRCEDIELWACPSSSGYGCGLPGVRQTPVSDDDAALVEMHVDIGGHLHDLCCAAHYSLPTGAGYSFRCNGCLGDDPAGAEACVNDTVVGAALSLPQSSELPCSAEWNYAVDANAARVGRWMTPFDTSLRWTSAQVVARNLAGAGSTYDVPAGDDVAPRYGAALAPSALDDVDHRAEAGTYLGTAALSEPYDVVRGTLGMLPDQIGSFCVSGAAELDDTRGGWVCR